MFPENVQGFDLYKIPKKITKELALLQDDEKSLLDGGFLSIIIGTPEKTIDEYEQGLSQLKERWLEYISKRSPSDAVVGKTTAELETCAQVIHRLKDLVLNPLPLEMKPQIIHFTESREDISFFSSPEEREWAVQEALKKLENVPLERPQWINLASAAGLSMCPCAGTQNRPIDEKKFLTTLIERYPPHPKQEICLMFLGSGGLMQEGLILWQLEKAGYSSVMLHLVDLLTKKEHLSSLKSLISSHLKISVTIAHTQNYLEFEEVESCRPYHAVGAFDFDSILYRGSTLNAWMAMDLASQCLRENGFLFCSAFLRNWQFDAKSGNWDIPVHDTEALDVSSMVADHRLDPLVLGCTSDEFFRGTFYYVVQLAKLKRDMVIKVINMKSIDSEGVLSDLTNLATKILVPHGEFRITIESANQTTTSSYDFFYGANCLIDETFLNTYIPQVKTGRIVVLSPHSYYWDEDDYLLKAEKCKKVHQLINSIKPLATNLAQTRSLQLKM